MRLITVHLPEPYIKGLEQLVEMGRYPNKSEAIRVAVRDLLANELWSNRMDRINFLSA
ncbi:MAG: CopG family transcriptional regulator [Thermoprotei archaeon]|nr:MAG: CopG family transcriptional regulator [Thermoprotei archaeon]RLE89999.1 MAG: CopG family transcriptional regulator [Thermoprotei archaeon]